MTNKDIIKMINEDKDIFTKLNENPTAEKIIAVLKAKLYYFLKNHLTFTKLWCINN